MVRQLEKDIEKRVCKIVKDFLGIENIKLNLSGNTGYPDRLFLMPEGKPLFIEFKRPGGILGKRQEYIINSLKLRGYNVEVHETVESAVRSIASAMGTKKISKRWG